MIFELKKIFWEIFGIFTNLTMQRIFFKKKEIILNKTIIERNSNGIIWNIFAIYEFQ